jgi:TrmH family RNA methyltransferase
MITSPANPKLRYVRHLERRSFRAREGRLPLEGVRLVSEALDSGLRPAFVLVSAPLAACPGGPGLRARLEADGVPVLEVAPGLLGELCQTATPQGVLAVVPDLAPPWPERPSLVLVADGLRDPGNLGTLLRAALAAGADGALLAAGTVDAGHPKALRAGMGAHFRLPRRAVGQSDLAGALDGLAVWVADARGELAYTEVSWRERSAVVVGGEADGPGAALLALARGSVRIPMVGPAESLNAAMAGTVILFEAARQRAAPPIGATTAPRS